MLGRFGSNHHALISNKHFTIAYEETCSIDTYSRPLFFYAGKLFMTIPVFAIWNALQC